jgi:hypothetical protein
MEEARHMTRNHVKTVSVAAGHDRPALSKGQRAFNALIKQIENRRAWLAAWEIAIPPYQRKYASELVPLVEGAVDLRVQLVQGLDRACDHRGLTKSERRTIAGVIVDLAGELVAARDDAQMKVIYNKHSQSDYDSEEAAGLEGLKSVFEDMLGLELGDDLDLNSPEEILERAREQVRERQEQEDAERQARTERRAKRKKSAKQLAREAQQLADEQQLRQSIREIYRKLASAIHPDRETDPREHARKTTLMQRANQAYEKNNLLQLLELQLELEHIDQSAINNISEHRLKHYNKILKEQLIDLDHEIMRVEDSFRAQFGLDPFDDLSPQTIIRDLAVEIVSARRTIRALKKDLLAIEDIKTLKAWLKALRHRPQLADIGELPF